MSKIKGLALVAMLILSHIIYETHSTQKVIDSVAATQGVNVPPVVEILPDVSSGKAPLTVNFDGEAWDQDGEIVSLEWDCEGDGLFEFVKSLQGLQGAERVQAVKQELQRKYTYTKPGIYHALVRATDDKEESSISSVTIQVFSGRPWLDIVPSNKGEFEYMALAGYEAFFKDDIAEDWSIRFQLKDAWISYKLEDTLTFSDCSQ